MQIRTRATKNTVKQRAMKINVSSTLEGYFGLSELRVRSIDQHCHCKWLVGCTRATCLVVRVSHHVRNSSRSDVLGM